MRNFGIIAEFNPFHNGHQYLFDAVRSQYSPDGIVCVMSGNFVQRGYPAVIDKWDRAEMAVSCGADLVVELPALFVLNSASEFAFGGIRILKGLGNITDLAFGSESGDLAALERQAAVSADDEKVKEGLAKGMSYPAAVSAATGVTLEPNDILAAEYIRQNSLQQTGFALHAVKRSGRGHIATASYIRENMAEVEMFMPEDALDVLYGSRVWDDACDRRLFEMLRYALFIKQPEELQNILSVGEGLENALKKAAPVSHDFNELVLNAKSRRYTYARISRILMQMALGIEKDLYAAAKESPLYIRVLAMNARGREILKESKTLETGCPIISNLSKLDVMKSRYKGIIETDIQASDLYSILTERSVTENSDLAKSPRILG